MKKTIKRVLLTPVIFGMTCGSALALQVNWDFDNGSAALYQDGSAISSGGLTFQLGSFASGFDFAGSSFDDWVSNWNTTGLIGSTVSWQNLGNDAFPSFGRLGATGTAGTVVRPDGLTGSQGYIWGYTSLDVGSVPEWIILTNTDWVFPAGTAEGGAALPGADWSVLDAGTTMIFGSAFNLADGAAALDRVFQTQAIPEPSTYALIFGLGILGFLGYRRVRK